MRVSVKRGDVLKFKVDVLALKYAQELHGVEHLVIRHISDEAKPPISLPKISEIQFIDTNGKIGAKTVLLVGVKPPEEYKYQSIREFGRKVLTSLVMEAPQTRHLGLTVHGIGYGLDETKSFKALVLGLSDAITSGSYPRQLEQITIVEQNAARVIRLRELIAKLIPINLEQRAYVFGIDLGTTYSCIAYIDEYGHPVTIPNAEGDRTTPSVIFFDGPNRVVGKEAKDNIVLHPDQVVAFVKRLLGQEDWTFFYDRTEYRAEEISSFILRKVVNDAETALGYMITDVVITCPSYFGIDERKAIAKAGEIAGLNVRSIIDEPIAATIYYSLHDEKDQVVLVYDLGGGTFDIAMVEIKGGEINVIATGGDHYLGGNDWDNVIVYYLAEQWKTLTDSSEDLLDDLETVQDIFSKAEQVKKSLSAREKTDVAVIYGDRQVKITLTRKKFDELTANLLEQTIELTHSMLREARKKGYNQFDQILLVGGSTRMPQVANRLWDEFKLEPKIFEPDEAVAKGAAWYGQRLIGSFTSQAIEVSEEKLGFKPEKMSGISKQQLPDIISIHKERLNSLLQMQQIYYRNLNEMEKRAALYGINVPIEIINQIDYFKEKIKAVEEEILTLSDARKPN